jgi:hypothetical protein
VLSFAKRAETLRHLRLSEPWYSAIAEPESRLQEERSS